jgi:hypothetical protein
MSADWMYVSVLEAARPLPPVIYPNPFHETLAIETFGQGEIWNASLVDLQGKPIKYKASVATPFLWDLGDLTPGIYILRLEQIAPQRGLILPPVRVVKS